MRVQLNSAIAVRCQRCRGHQASLCLVRAWTKGMGSVCTMNEVADGLVDDKDFSVEGGVVLFSFDELAAGKTQGARLSVYHLLQNSSDGDVAGICGDNERLLGIGKN
ncbi:hypothetical protein Pcinc_003305 [Petrolisthes cinctipes]|uniref:Uncharacterized protein n=1 Tax=Petrolisthes cinctipes TaxID=88211 RepID=A0AAE1GJK1_PETCI|nr:hypothetical protein Pcinc_010387 [Petrolisthes cinctipes]KAK3892834.1 hypothetical protein Pcinc_003305 [Petrolisthes cinctipes]